MVRMLEWDLDCDRWSFSEFASMDECGKGREALEVIAFHEWDGAIDGAIVAESGGMVLWYNVDHWTEDDLNDWEIQDAEARFGMITENDDWAWVGDKVSL